MELNLHAPSKINGVALSHKDNITSVGLLLNSSEICHFQEVHFYIWESYVFPEPRAAVYEPQMTEIDGVYAETSVHGPHGQFPIAASPL